MGRFHVHADGTAHEHHLDHDHDDHDAHPTTVTTITSTTTNTGTSATTAGTQTGDRTRRGARDDPRRERPHRRANRADLAAARRDARST